LCGRGDDSPQLMRTSLGSTHRLPCRLRHGRASFSLLGYRMPITPKRKSKYALTPAVGVGAVAAMTVFLGVDWVRPPIYLASSVRTSLMVAVFLTVASGFYRWRVWRRERDSGAYSVRSGSAWSLEEDWRHQIGLWTAGLTIGGILLALLHVMYRLGWLRWAWPQ
jgi:hypothetical protein